MKLKNHIPAVAFPTLPESGSLGGGGEGGAGKPEVEQFRAVAGAFVRQTVSMIPLPPLLQTPSPLHSR